MINMTVEDIIKKSITDANLSNEKKGENGLEGCLIIMEVMQLTNILRIILIPLLFRKFLVIMLILLEGLLIK